MRYLAASFFLLVLLLTSCFRQAPPPQATPPNQVAGSLVGEVDITFELQPQADLQTASLRVQGTSVGDLPLESLSSGLIDKNGVRYLYGTFRVSNTSSSSWDNLSLYALNRPNALGGTAITEMLDSNNDALTDPVLARTLLPSHRMEDNNGGLSVKASEADFQAFTAAEAAAVQSQGTLTADGKTVLEYGFVARNSTGQRAIGAGESGFVSIAVRYPYDPTSATAYPVSFSLAFAAVDEPVTRVSRSPEENANSAADVCTRGAAVGASEVFVIGNSDPSNVPAGCTVTRISDVKVAIATSGVPELYLLAPAVPRNLAANPSNGAITLAWDANLETDLAGYRLYRDSSLIYEGLNTTYTDVGLTNGTAYSYTISAYNTGGYESAQSPSVQATPQEPSSGGQPIWLEAETAASGPSFAPWIVYSDGEAGAGEYIEVRTGSNSTGSPPADGEATYNFTVGEAGTYKIWGRVIAPTSAKDSVWLRVDSGTWYKWNNMVKSSTWLWDAVHDSDNGNQVLSFSLSAGTHTLSVKYRERYTRVDKFHITNDLSFTPSGQGGAHNDGTGSGGDTTPPTVPSGLSATEGDTQVFLSWSANTEPDLAGYRLYRDGTQIYAGSATSYTDTGLSNGVTYSYTLAAYDTSANQSAQSSAVDATPNDPPGPDTPTGLSATSGDTHVQLSWNANSESNLAGYRLYRDSAQIYQGASTSFTDTGLANGTSYSYTVSAYDIDGLESAQSGAVIGIPKLPLLRHIFGNGQSFMSGSQSTPPLSTTQAFDTKMFSSIRKPTDMTSLNPMIEQTETFYARTHGETIASGMTAQIRTNNTDMLLYSMDFINGMRISGLDKGSQAYAGNIAQVAAGKAFASDYEVSAITWIHGGGDMEAGTSYGSYKGLLQNMYTDYGIDIAAETGQPENPIMLVGQASHWTTYSQTTSPIPLAQLQASRDTSGMYLVGPEYPYGRVADGRHFTNHSQRWYGSQFGKVYDLIVNQNVTWRPLEPNSTVFNNGDIVINFHVPAPPLVWDTSLVSNPGDYGFEIYDETAASTISITTPIIENGTSVRITPSSPLQSGHSYRLRIAYSGVIDNAGGPTTGPRSNLRDSDATIAFYDGATSSPYPLYNWAVTVDELVGTFSGSGGDTTPPSTPVNLSASPGDTQVQLSWTANSESDLAGYRLYRDSAQIYQGASTSFTDTGLANGVTYSYEVSAYDSSGNESAQSSSVSATPSSSSSAVAIRFNEDASPSQYFTISDNADLSLPNGDWTIGLWTKVDNNQGSVYKYPLSSGQWGLANSFNLALAESSNGARPDKWVVRIEGRQLNSSSSPGGDGVWRLIIVQRKGSNFEMYFVEKNGAPSLQASNSVNSVGVLDGGDWIIGGRADFSSTRFFGGDVAEIFMGDFLLSNAEMTQLGAGSTILDLGKAPKVYHSVIKTGNTLVDQSGNGHDAVQSGNPVTTLHPF